LSEKALIATFEKVKKAINNIHPEDPKHRSHEGNTMRKIMGNKPLVSSAIIIHSPLQISWNDLLYQGQTADVSIILA
jgi:hypothetical protein